MKVLAPFPTCYFTDGEYVEYSIFGPPHARRVVVFIPGTPMASSQFFHRPEMERYLKNHPDTCCVVFTRPGYGTLPKPMDNIHMVGERLQRVLQALGKEVVSVVSHSGGTHLGMVLAHRLNVLWVPLAPVVPDAWLSTYESQSLTTRWMRDMSADQPFVFRCFCTVLALILRVYPSFLVNYWGKSEGDRWIKDNPAMRQVLAANLCRASLAGGAGMYFDYWDLMQDHWEVLRPPQVQVIGFADDMASPPYMVRALATKMGVRARFWQGGHFSPWQMWDKVLELCLLPE